MSDDEVKVLVDIGFQPSVQGCNCNQMGHPVQVLFIDVERSSFNYLHE